MLDDENLFSYPYFYVTHQDPTAKFLKLYVRVVNSIHFMQNGDENRVKIRVVISPSFSQKMIMAPGSTGNDCRPRVDI
jgi:hypothetical protein